MCYNYIDIEKRDIMDKEVTEEYVLHVAHLGRLKLAPEEVERYKHQLKQILDEINKINELEFEDDILISPSSNTNVFSSKESNKTNPKDIISNAPKTNGNFIEVRWEKND
jgi:aspartyl/glutamyl-tRNA(Asn/Gln) amidotransferase C subunit